MDILTEHWLPLLLALLPSVLAMVAFAILRRGEMTKVKKILLGVTTVVAILGGVLLSFAVLAVGGDMELILTLLLIPLLISLI